MSERVPRRELASTVAKGVALTHKLAPAFVAADMRLNDDNGLEVIEALHRRRPDARGTVLTGYGNIASAVTAVKLGTIDSLGKPADANEIHKAFMTNSEITRRPAGQPHVSRPGALGAHTARATNYATAIVSQMRADWVCIAAHYSGPSPKGRPR